MRKSRWVIWCSALNSFSRLIQKAKVELVLNISLPVTQDICAFCAHNLKFCCVRGPDSYRLGLPLAGCASALLPEPDAVIATWPLGALHAHNHLENKGVTLLVDILDPVYSVVITSNRGHERICLELREFIEFIQDSRSGVGIFFLMSQIVNIFILTGNIILLS